MSIRHVTIVEQHSEECIHVEFSDESERGILITQDGHNQIYVQRDYIGDLVAALQQKLEVQP